MAKKRKNIHVGGEQLILISPPSDWVHPGALPDLRQRGRVVALDRECRDDGLSSGRGPGWAFGAGHVAGVSLAWRDGDAIRSGYWPIRHPDTADCVDPDQMARWERDHAAAGVTFAMQHAPYDVGWGSSDLGVPCPPAVHDTTCMANVIDENRLSYDLDSLCTWRGLPGKDERLLREAASAYGFNPKRDLWRLPARYVGEYGETDAVRTLQLFESFDPEIDRQNVREAYQLEMDLLPMVHAMRARGIRVDLDACEVAKERLRVTADAAFAELTDKLGTQVSIDEVRRNAWMIRAFESQNLRFPRDAKGVAHFESKWMSKQEHWLPRLIARAKAYEDASEKFVQGFIVNFAHLGRLHASINQFRSEDGGTRTYRFSYSDPPLQQMPNRNEELATIIRGLFLPEEGDVWLAADYSQQEYRMIVHFAELLGCARAEEAGNRYRSDPRTDFHNMVVEMTGLDRQPAKDSNFAKAYGAGVDKFAQMIGKSREEAEAIMKQYDEKLPFVSELNERCEKRAERVGFIRLLDGARIHYDTWEPRWLSKDAKSRGWAPGSSYKMSDCELAEAQERVAQADHPWYGARLRRARCRKAMNALSQGSAARQTKMAMRACWQAGHLPLLQMHDELDFSVRRERDGREIVELMRDVVKLRVPMVVDAEYGVTWGRARVQKDKAGRVAYDASFEAAMRELRTAR